MTKVQKILYEINLLNPSELEVILQELLKRVDQEKSIKSILNKYRGIGDGIWDMDAQKFVDKERDNDRE